MFDPDGTGTVVLMWLIALAAVVSFGILGHRVGQRTMAHAAGRAGSSLATALLVALAATTTLNHQYGWYTSWADMWSSVTGDHPKGVAATYGAPQRQSHESRSTVDKVNTEADAKYAAQRQAFEKSLKLKPGVVGGQWVKINIPGLGVKGHDIGRTMVWLPESYTKNPRRTYPVIEAFHGMPGGTLDFERVFKLHERVNDAVKAGHMSDAIIIVPQEMPKGIDTECVDGGGIPEETWLTKDVPNFVISHLRAQADRESWLALGVSAGGWCASMAGLLHPDRYAGVVSLGGYFKPDFSSGWNPFAGKPLPAKYDLVKRVKEKPTDQAFWVLISGADKLSKSSTESFVKAVKPPMALTTVDYPNAGHRVDVWERALPDVMTWVGKTFWTFGPKAIVSMPSATSSSATATRSQAPTTTTPPRAQTPVPSGRVAHRGHKVPAATHAHSGSR